MKIYLTRKQLKGKANKQVIDRLVDLLLQNVEQRVREAAAELRQRHVNDVADGLLLALAELREAQSEVKNLGGAIKLPASRFDRR